MTYDPQNRKRDPLMGQGSVHPPIQPATDGYLGPEQPPIPRADWQRTGYHMEDQPCDDDQAWVLDEENDTEVLPIPDDLPMVDPELDIDPVTDSPVDPELQHQKNPFWRDQPRASSAVPQGGEKKEQISGPQPSVQTQPEKRSLAIVAVLFAIVALVAFALIRNTFLVQEVEVVGCESYTQEQVRRIAQLQPGMGLMQVDEAAVKQRITSDRYLQFVSLVTQQHKVILTIRERKPAAYTSVLGIFYTMDSRGMVLQEYTTEDRITDLVLVDKLNVESCIPGQYIVFRSEDTLPLYVQLMIEIRAMSLQPEILSVNIDDPSDLSLYTRDGYFVHLGDSTYLHGKLRAMMLVLESLRNDPEVTPGGVIDVSSRAYPTYDPPDY